MSDRPHSLSSDDRQRYANALADIVPLDVSNQRIVRPSRRGFVKIAPGVFATALTPACGAVLALGAVLIISKLLFDLIEEITGDVIITNDGNSSIDISGLFGLREQGGAIVDDDEPPIWTLPPGDNFRSFGNMQGQNAGAHFVDLLLAGDVYTSDQFMIQS